MTEHAVSHLYLHIPYCARKCPYCDFNSIAGREAEHEAYVTALLQEVARLPPGPYETVFIGGGTPTELPRKQLQRFVTGVANHIQLTADYEWTCEANPGSSDEETFAVLKDAGVNRLSIGVQAVQDHHLKFLGRIHSSAEADRVVAAARSLMPRVSADCIIGLPNQSVAELEDTIAFFERHQLDHASVYHLAIEPGTEFHARHARGELQVLDQDRSRFLLQHAWQQLSDLGLEPYETSNFARNGEACRHNLAYWRQRDYHAAGAGAVSTLGGERVTRQPHSGRYIAAITERGTAPWKVEHLSAHDQLVEAWMLGLRLTEGVSVQRLEALGDQRDRWLPVARRLHQEGCLTLTDERLALTPSGRAVQDAITVQLMPDDDSASSPCVEGD